jgi:hypothetical protein
VNEESIASNLGLLEPDERTIEAVDGDKPGYDIQCSLVLPATRIHKMKRNYTLLTCISSANRQLP